MKILIVALLVSVLPMSGTFAASEPLDKESIIHLQNCLNDKGFDAGVADGVAGKKTIAAGREFRKALIAAQGKTGQIPITDEIDKKLLFACGMSGASVKNTQNDDSQELPLFMDKQYQLRIIYCL